MKIDDLISFLFIWNMEWEWVQKHNWGCCDSVSYVKVDKDEFKIVLLKEMQFMKYALINLETEQEEGLLMIF